MKLDIKQDVLTVKHGGCSLPISLACPEFAFEGETVGGNSPLQIKGDAAAGKQVEMDFAPIPLSGGGQFDVKLFVKWSPKEHVLRKWASFRLVNSDTAPLLREVIL